MATERPLVAAMVLHEDSRGLRVLLQGLDDALTDGLGADEAEPGQPACPPAKQNHQQPGNKPR